MDRLVSLSISFLAGGCPLGRSQWLALCVDVTMCDHFAFMMVLRGCRRMTWHLGSRGLCRVPRPRRHLRWEADGERTSATLDLSPLMAWTAHHAETDPARRWYLTAFGDKEPTTTLVGAGNLRGHVTLRTTLAFLEVHSDAHERAGAALSAAGGSRPFGRRCRRGGSLRRARRGSRRPTCHGSTTSACPSSSEACFSSCSLRSSWGCRTVTTRPASAIASGWTSATG